MSADNRQFAWLARNIRDIANGLQLRADMARAVLPHNDYVYFSDVAERYREISDEVECLLHQVIPPSARVPAVRPQHVEDAGNVVKLDAWRRKA